MTTTRLIVLLFISTIINFSCSVKKTINCENNIAYKRHSKQEKYQSILNKYSEKGLTGISVLIDKNDEDLWAGTAGVASIESNQNLKTCDIFPVGSLGKMYCGVATMQLVEKGLLKLNETIDHYLPVNLVDKVPNSRSIILANLLSHTSGIIDYADDPNLLDDFMSGNMDFKRETVLEKYVYNRKPKFEPGTKYSYSNSNYEILTLIIDNILGESHANRYTKNIFKPLKLTSTYYKNESNYTDLLKSGMARGYFDMDGDGNLEDATDISLIIAKGQTGSDGIVTNTHDLYIFTKAIFENKLVSKATLETMKEYTKNKYAFTTYKYGLGLTFRDNEKNYGLGMSIGHSGSLPGYATEAWFFPIHKTYIIFISNNGNIFEGQISDLLEEFKKELYQTVLN